MEKEILCDREGVPLLVQDIQYVYGGFWFEVTFFNGRSKRFDASLVTSLDLCSKGLTPMQWLEAEQIITVLTKKNWSTWFSVAASVEPSSTVH